MAGESKWEDTFYVTAYEMARAGSTNAMIGKTLGISKLTFYKWLERRPALADAVKRGREARGRIDGNTGTFQEYVFKQLPPALQKMWSDIHAWSDEPNGIVRIEAMLSQGGKRCRQQLFLHALVHNNFNASEALRTVNLSKGVLAKWIDDEPEFAEMMDEIHWHKKNFFEAGLVDLVDRGDAPATIFANKTFNADRGYNEKLRIQMEGTVTHLHAAVPLEALDLPVEVLDQVLAAVRRRAAALGATPGTSPAALAAPVGAIIDV